MAGQIREKQRPVPYDPGQQEQPQNRIGRDVQAEQPPRDRLHVEQIARNRDDAGSHHQREIAGEQILDTISEQTRS